MIHYPVRYMLPVGVAVSNLLILIIILLLQKVLDLRHGAEISVLEWISVICVPIISMILSVVTLDKCTDEIAVIVGGIGLLTMNIFVFCIFDYLGKLYQKQKQVLILDAQNQAYQKQMEVLATEERISAFRHDMNNHMTMIRHLAKQGDNEELWCYADEIQGIAHVEDSFSETGNPLVDGMLNLKFYEMVKTFQAQVTCTVQVQGLDTMERTDISILLGNLLDNVIQALKNSSGIRKVSFEMEKKRGLLYIQVQNSYNGSIEEKDGELITTKKDKRNHGIGLKNVERIVEKYHGNLEISYNEAWFTVEVLLFLD